MTKLSRREDGALRHFVFYVYRNSAAGGNS